MTLGIKGYVVHYIGIKLHTKAKLYVLDEYELLEEEWGVSLETKNGVEL